jgi:hypothetical protein
MEAFSIVPCDICSNEVEQFMGATLNVGCSLAINRDGAVSYTIRAIAIYRETTTYILFVHVHHYSQTNATFPVQPVSNSSYASFA